MDKHLHLTPEQWRVAQAIVRGEPVTQTCHRLGISEPRYRKDVRSLLDRVGAESRHDLIVRLRQPETR